VTSRGNRASYITLAAGVRPGPPPATGRGDPTLDLRWISPWIWAGSRLNRESLGKQAASVPGRGHDPNPCLSHDHVSSVSERYLQRPSPGGAGTIKTRRAFWSWLSRPHVSRRTPHGRRPRGP